MTPLIFRLMLALGVLMPLAATAVLLGVGVDLPAPLAFTPLLVLPPFALAAWLLRPRAADAAAAVAALVPPAGKALVVVFSRAFNSKRGRFTVTLDDGTVAAAQLADMRWTAFPVTPGAHRVDILPGILRRADTLAVSLAAAGEVAFVRVVAGFMRLKLRAEPDTPDLRRVLGSMRLVPATAPPTASPVR